MDGEWKKIWDQRLMALFKLSNGTYRRLQVGTIRDYKLIFRRNMPELEPSILKISPPWWAWPQLLGLEAVAVALVWLQVFAATTTARLTASHFIVLGAAVWCIYIIDRMIDGLLRTGSREERHIFAARGRWWLIPLLLVVIAWGGYHALYRIEGSITEAGFSLCVIVAGYFGLAWMTRQRWAGSFGAVAVAGVMALALIQGVSLRDEGTSEFSSERLTLLVPHLWRAVMAGFLITVLIVSLRQEGGPGAWLLPRKLLFGWIFAIGVALSPMVKVFATTDPREMLASGEILLFAAVCGMNSLGIRLWETNTRRGLESMILSRLFPGMLATIFVGSLLEAWAGDRWNRPAILASGGAVLGIFAVHLVRHRFSTNVLRLGADGAILFGGLAALAWGRYFD